MNLNDILNEEDPKIRDKYVDILKETYTIMLVLLAIQYGIYYTTHDLGIKIILLTGICFNFIVYIVAWGFYLYFQMSSIVRLKRKSNK
jgi:hypothetical protein